MEVATNYFLAYQEQRPYASLGLCISEFTEEMGAISIATLSEQEDCDAFVHQWRDMQRGGIRMASQRASNLQ